MIEEKKLREIDDIYLISELDKRGYVCMSREKTKGYVKRTEEKEVTEEELADLIDDVYDGCPNSNWKTVAKAILTKYKLVERMGKENHEDKNNI